MIDGICYEFLRPDYLDFADAEAFCAFQGGHLAKLDSCEQFREVLLFIVSQAYNRTFWIGGNDRVEEGLWLWEDGSPVDMGSPFWVYTSSETTEPSGGTAENCLILNSDYHYLYDDADCSAEYSAICQMLPMLP